MQPSGPITFNRINPRPVPPSPNPNHLTVASFNTLSFFSTIDTGPDICGPAKDQGCRGADSSDELIRQRTKVINAILAINADIISLMEIENHPQDEAETDLVANLNAVAGAGTFAAIETGPISIDVIKVALIYKPERVTPLGSQIILDNSIDPTYVDSANHPSLIQTFTEVSSGEIITLAVRHLKSKGSPCDAIGDPDVGDGQGNCNLTRTAGAAALVNYLFSDPTNSGDLDFLIIGDLNAYAKEDPIDILKDSGFYDLIERYLGPGA